MSNRIGVIYSDNLSGARAQAQVRAADSNERPGDLVRSAGSSRESRGRNRGGFRGSTADPEDLETLEDLVTVAVNDALTKASDAAQKRMSSVTGGMRIPGLM